MASEDRNKLTLGRLIRLAIVMEVFLILTFAPSQWLVGVVKKDREVVAGQLSEAASVQVIERTDRWYQAAMINTGAAEGMRRFVDRRELTWKLLEPRRIAFMAFVYAVMFRISIVTLWLPYLAPFLGAVALDGWVRREIAKWRFSFVSPLHHRYASRVGLGALAVGLGFMLTPIPFSPYIFPAVFGVFGLSVWLWIANTQKRI